MCLLGYNGVYVLYSLLFVSMIITVVIQVAYEYKRSRPWKSADGLYSLLPDLIRAIIGITFSWYGISGKTYTVGRAIGRICYHEIFFVWIISCLISLGQVIVNSLNANYEYSIWLLILNFFFINIEFFSVLTFVFVVLMCYFSRRELNNMQHIGNRVAEMVIKQQLIGCCFCLFPYTVYRGICFGDAMFTIFAEVPDKFTWLEAIKELFYLGMHFKLYNLMLIKYNHKEKHVIKHVFADTPVEYQITDMDYFNRILEDRSAAMSLIENNQSYAYDEHF